jgi:hypothetical protein
VRPNGTTPGGCQLDCECNVAVKACDCSANVSECICNQCTGVCSYDVVCRPPSTPPTGTCPPCPVSDSNNLECAGNGVCDCGTCICAASKNVTGPACDVPTGAGQYTTCPECVINSNVWCNLLGVYVCATPADCTALTGLASATCDTPTPLLCEDNCTCPDQGGASHGTCVVEQGVAQCVCDSHYHGGNCCSRGGLSKGAIAGIAGGAVAGIVVAACVAFVALGYAAKRGVDWVQLKNQNMAAAHDNPVFKPRTTEHVNPLSESPR